MSSREDWEKFHECFLSAVTAVDEAHFLVHRHQGTSVHRERAYCYELYHQLRRLLPEEFRYVVHGEIDKLGHGIMQAAVGRGRNPDFVVHVPGQMNRNLAVVEVKRAGQSTKGDLGKIANYVRNARYQHGILLLFGDRNLRRRLSPDRRILIYHHRRAGEGPVSLAGPLEESRDE